METREILFEVRQQDGKLIGWERLNDHGQWEKSYVGRGDHWLLGVIFYETKEQKPLVRRQYTTKKDDNNKPIFEGDVLRFGSQMGSVSEVKFLKTNAAFLVKDKWGEWQWLYDVVASTNSLVIGNIFDNPELLK